MLWAAHRAGAFRMTKCFIQIGTTATSLTSPETFWVCPSQCPSFNSISSLLLSSSPHLGGCTVYYFWEPHAFVTPPKNPLVYERLYA
jgi:hypothetical protein